MLRILRRYAVITLGCCIYALAFCWCFQPNHMTFGGLTGVAQVLHFLFPVLPVGTVTLVMNVPLFLLTLKMIGGGSVANSLYAAILSSLFIDLLTPLYDFSAMEPLLACIYGGVLLGLAAGIMMLEETTTGGTELAARLLKFPFPRLSIGRLTMSLDVAVTLAYSAVYRDLTNALYSFIAIYICSVVMDMVVYGSSSAKMAYIISLKGPEIAEKIISMDMGLTILPGRGAYSGDPRQVLLCAFKGTQITAIKEAVRQMDPDAFIIVCNAHEVLGEGFGNNAPGSL